MSTPAAVEDKQPNGFAIRNKTSQSIFTPSWASAGLIFALVLGFVTRFYHLGYTYLDIDEAWQYQSSSYSFPQIVPNLWTDHSPLYFFFSHLLLKIHDTHDETLLRLPALVFGWLTIPAVYLLAKQLFDHKTGWVAAMLTACWPIWVQYSQEYRMYSLLVLLCSLSLYFLFRGLRSPDWQSWAAFTTITILNLYNHYVALFFTFSEAVVVVLYLLVGLLAVFKILPGRFLPGLETNQPKNVLTKIGFWLGSFGLCGLLYLPWLPHFFTFLTTPSYGLQRGHRNVDLTDIYLIFEANSLGAVSIAAPLTLALLVVGAVYSLNRQRLAVLLLVGLLVVPLLSVWLIQGSDTLVASYRYLLFLSLPILCLTARGVVSLTALLSFVIVKIVKAKAWNSRFSWASLVLLTLLLCGLSSQILIEYLYPRLPNERGVAAAFIRPQVQPADMLVSMTNPAVQIPRYEFDFYSEKLMPDTPRIKAGTPMSQAVLSNLAAASIQRLWLIFDFSEAGVSANQLSNVAQTDFKSDCDRGFCVLTDQQPNAGSVLKRLQKALGEYVHFQPAVLGPAAIVTQFMLEPAPFLAQPNLLTMAAAGVALPDSSSVFMPLQIVVLPQNYYLLSFCYSGQPRLQLSAGPADQSATAYYPGVSGYQPALYQTQPFGPERCQPDALAFWIPTGATRLNMRVTNVGNGPAEVKDLRLVQVPEQP